MVKYGILGCGFHSVKHAFTQEQIKNLDLYAVCDSWEPALTAFREKFSGVRTFTDLNAFLASGIEAVVIATPDAFHLQHAQLAVAAGLHILIEKPLIQKHDDLQTFRRLVQDAEKRKVVITACHPRRFDPPWVWLKKTLADQNLGRVLSVDYDFAYHNAQADRRFTGSFMAHEVSHDIDLLNFLFGYSGFSAHTLIDQRERYEVVGTRNTDGMVFHIRGLLTLEGQKVSAESIRVHFERNSLTLDTKSGEVVVHDYERESPDNKNRSSVFKKSWDDRSKNLMINFANSIEGSEPNYLSIRELLMSAEIGPLLAENANSKIVI